MIESTKYRAKLKTNKDIADRLGMIRQTLSHKRKYPSTFTCGEVLAMAKLFGWNNDEIGEFISGCKD